MSSSPRASRPAESAGKAPAREALRPPPKGRSAMTQVSLARLLGVGDLQPASNVSITLNMSSAAGSSSSAAPAATPDAEVTLAAHERPRGQKRKPPEGPRGRAKAGRMTAESRHIKRDSRLVEFPDQGLKIAAGDLFCQPCKTTLPNIRNSIASHLSTNKHKINLLKFVNRQVADDDLRSELTDYFEANPDEKTVSANAPPTSKFSPTHPLVCTG